MLKFWFTHEETLQTQETRITSLKQVIYSLLSAQLCARHSSNKTTVSLLQCTIKLSQWHSYGHHLCDLALHSRWYNNCVTVVAAQCQADTALTFCCSGSGPRQLWSSGLVPVSRFHSSVPLSHSSLSLIGLLAYVDVSNIIPTIKKKMVLKLINCVTKQKQQSLE